MGNISLEDLLCLKTVMMSLYILKTIKDRLKIPIVIYADFECFLKPVSCKKLKNKTRTFITHGHKLMSYAFYVKIDYSTILKYLTKKF